MWFLLRMILWLCIVLVLLPSIGSQSVPKSQVSASEALRAAKVVATDIQHFCERQRESMRRRVAGYRNSRPARASGGQDALRVPERAI